MEKNNILNLFSVDLSSSTKPYVSNEHFVIMHDVVKNSNFFSKFNSISLYTNLIQIFFKIDKNYKKYGVLKILNNLNNLPFDVFFRSNFIDTPQCLRVNKSIKYEINKFELAKFATILMRNGKKTYYLNLLMSSINFIQENFNSNTLKLNFKNILLLKNTNNVINRIKLYDRHLPIKNKIFFNLELLSSIFCFYIYKVKKKIYKNTRGKSGKFTFLWKYIPIYKRFKLTMFWLSKDFQTRAGHTNFDRLKSLMSDLIFNYENLDAWHVKKFSHNYIYRNAKNTIGTNYKTSKK